MLLMLSRPIVERGRDGLHNKHCRRFLSVLSTLADFAYTVLPDYLPSTSFHQLGTLVLSYPQQGQSIGAIRKSLSETCSVSFSLAAHYIDYPISVLSLQIGCSA